MHLSVACFCHWHLAITDMYTLLTCICHWHVSIITCILLIHIHIHMYIYVYMYVSPQLPLLHLQQQSSPDPPVVHVACQRRSNTPLTMLQVCCHLCFGTLLHSTSALCLARAWKMWATSAGPRDAMAWQQVVTVIEQHLWLGGTRWAACHTQSIHSTLAARAMQHARHMCFMQVCQ